MSKQRETQILAAIRKSEPEKKRVTFFISVESKGALAAWCKKNNVTESSAVEKMIRATTPAQYYRKK